MPMLHDAVKYDFGSDNYAGAHPAVLEAMVAANGGHVGSYGDDPYTARLQEVMKGHFGADARAFPVFNGTGANVIALQSMLPRWGAVVAPASAHINTDENAAPERIAGIKIVPRPSADGRLDPATIPSTRVDADDVHSVHPLAVSFSNTTELGSVHSVAQVREIVTKAKDAGLLVHCDGSRLANAAVAAGVSLGEITEGVDVISLGATKLGAVAVEAVVVRNPEAVVGLEMLRKIDLQLASKQRFLSAQLLALYEGEVWRENASNANAQAARLGEAVAALEGCSVLYPVEANAVFAVLPEGVADAVRERGWHFYDWGPAGIPGAVRMMTAWDTPAEAVESFVRDIKDCVAAAR